MHGIITAPADVCALHMTAAVRLMLCLRFDPPTAAVTLSQLVYQFSLSPHHYPNQ